MYGQAERVSNTAGQITFFPTKEPAFLRVRNGKILCLGKTLEPAGKCRWEIASIFYKTAHSYDSSSLAIYREESRGIRAQNSLYRDGGVPPPSRDRGIKGEEANIILGFEPSFITKQAFYKVMMYAGYPVQLSTKIIIALTPLITSGGDQPPADDTFVAAIRNPDEVEAESDAIQAAIKELESPDIEKSPVTQEAIDNLTHVQRQLEVQLRYLNNHPSEMIPQGHPLPDEWQVQAEKIAERNAELNREDSAWRKAWKTARDNRNVAGLDALKRASERGDRWPPGAPPSADPFPPSTGSAPTPAPGVSNWWNGKGPPPIVPYVSPPLHTPSPAPVSPPPTIPYYHRSAPTGSAPDVPETSQPTTQPPITLGPAD